MIAHPLAEALAFPALFQEAPALFRIARSQILVGPNPRTVFEDGKLAELTASMKARGFDPAFPLVVRPINHVRVEIVGENTPEQRWEILESPFLFSQKTDEQEDSRTWTLVSKTANEEDVAELVRRACRFEIAAGESRYRAAGDAGLLEVVCVVRPMTDCQMLELALLENVQRASLNPMDEARGYARLLQHYASEGLTKRADAIAQISARIGREWRTVDQYVSLVRLDGEPAGDALAKGTLPVGQARVIARLPSREMREEVTRKVLRSDRGPSPMPEKDLQAMINEDYSRQLRGATFDPADPDLVPVALENGERVSGGDCTTCPSNTRNLEQQTGTRFHFCTNTPCFRAKTRAAHEKWVSSVHNPEQRTIALPWEDNARLWDQTGTKLAPAAEFVELTDAPASFDLKADVILEPGSSWKALVRGQQIQTVLARDDKGKVHELAKHDVAIAAAMANGHLLFRGVDPEPLQELVKKQTAPAAEESRADVVAGRIARDDQDKAAALKAQREKERKARHYAAEVKAVLDAAASSKPPEGFRLLVLDALIAAADEHSEAVAVARRHGFSKKDPKEAVAFLQAKALELPEPFQQSLEVELLLNLYLEQRRREVLPNWAKAFGADLKGARKRVDAEIKAEEESAAAVAEIAAGIDWKSRKEKAEEFRWTHAGLADNADRAEILLPSKKLHASVSLARSEKGWHVGWFADGTGWGGGEPANRNNASYANRTLALRTGLLAIEDRLKIEKAPAAVLERVAAYLEHVTTGKKGSK